ncbi:hypothetical protein RBJ75_08195 [Rhodopseudomonas sp. BAL398]|nr:hypothetical protein [Rhodopseudomonas sp. BAL398]WOK19482.1 hypothetical protein RBJ75_08195 [Rhodopseudomonas sp. BAL398]
MRTRPGSLPVDDAGQRGKDRPEFVVDSQRIGIGHQPATRTIKQLAAERRFQFGQRAADCRLRQPKALCRYCRLSRFDQRTQNLKLTKSEAGPPLIIFFV